MRGFLLMIHLELELVKFVQSVGDYSKSMD